MSTPSGCWPRLTGCLAAAAGEERWPCERAGWLCGSWFGVAGLDDNVSSRFEPPTITCQLAQDEALGRPMPATLTIASICPYLPSLASDRTCSTLPNGPTLKLERTSACYLLLATCYLLLATCYLLLATNPLELSAPQRGRHDQSPQLPRPNLPAEPSSTSVTCPAEPTSHPPAHQAPL
jgi:hypothetical protein